MAAVDLHDGLVFIGVGGKIRVFETFSGELIEDFALGNQRVAGMSRTGDPLYVTLLDIPSNQRILLIVDASPDSLVARGSVALPNIASVSDPFVDGTVAWIPAGDRLITVNVAAPQNTGHRRESAGV